MPRILDIEKMLKNCTICPRGCRVDRTKERSGFCRATGKLEICAGHLHFGEEPPISGTRGSGTIFFNHCNMYCVYCQNYSFSQEEEGKEFEVSELKDLMLSLQVKKAHNINLVTPTHYALHIINALIEARKCGLNIPLVYNTSGYEKLDTLKMLDGLVDIYLTDMRYGDDTMASKYSSCPDYVKINKSAVAEMYRQVGHLKMRETGVAQKGIIIRHLVLPLDISGTENIFKFISHQLGDETYISLMSQYYPTYKAMNYRDISRRINKKEYNKALTLLHKYNLKNGWVQEYMGDVDSDFAGTNIKPNV